MQAIIRILVNHEPAYQVTLDLGLKSNGMLANWIRGYRKNGYNVVIKLPYDQTGSRNQASEARKRALTPTELVAD